MAESLKSKFRILWTDEADPSRGFKYVYLTPEDYEKMLTKVPLFPCLLAVQYLMSMFVFRLAAM
jgi:hypothetical protein